MAGGSALAATARNLLSLSDAAAIAGILFLAFSAGMPAGQSHKSAA